MPDKNLTFTIDALHQEKIVNITITHDTHILSIVYDNLHLTIQDMSFDSDTPIIFEVSDIGEIFGNKPKEHAKVYDTPETRQGWGLTDDDLYGLKYHVSIESKNVVVTIGEDRVRACIIMNFINNSLTVESYIDYFGGDLGPITLFETKALY